MLVTQAANREGHATRNLARIQAEIDAFKELQAKRDTEHLLSLNNLEKTMTEKHAKALQDSRLKIRELESKTTRQADPTQLQDLGMEEVGQALRESSVKPGEMFGIYKEVTVPRHFTFDQIEDEIEKVHPGSNPIIKGPEKDHDMWRESIEVSCPV